MCLEKKKIKCDIHIIKTFTYLYVPISLRFPIFFSGTVVGLFSTQYDEPLYQEAAAGRKPDFDIMTNYVQIPEEETRIKGDFLRSLSVTPSPTFAAPVPYYTTAGLAIIK